MTTVSQDSVSSQATMAELIEPSLQRADGSYIGVDSNNNLVAVDTGGNILWQQQVSGASSPQITPLYVTAEAGVIATSSLSGTSVGGIVWSGPGPLPAQLGTLYTVDQNGNVTSQVADTGAVNSWSGEWYVGTGSQVIDPGTPPADLDPVSFSAVVGGNPSGNRVAMPQCPCMVQSTQSTASNFAPTNKRPDHFTMASQRFQLAKYSPRSFEFALSSIDSPRYSVHSFQSGGGSSKTYLQLIGDGGFAGSVHNVGNLFNLAAATDADRLTASGSNTVIPFRVSSVQDFNAGLTTSGVIDGGVTYFGHAAEQEQSASRSIMLLALSPFSGVFTNVSALDVYMLSNANLAPDVKITLRGCHAGLKSSTGDPSIAQLIANQLGRKVLAWKIGLWFTADPARRAPTDKEIAPSVKPIYLIPFGGVGVQPCTFTPNRPEPTNCGGGK
jgi:hypothetical protein